LSRKKYVSMHGIRLFSKKISGNLVSLLNKALDEDGRLYSIKLLRDECEILNDHELITKVERLEELLLKAKETLTEIYKKLK